MYQTQRNQMQQVQYPRFVCSAYFSERWWTDQILLPLAT
jgi:hypothetical protein